MGPTPTRSVVRLTAAASVLLLIAAACSTSTGAASGSGVAASPAPAASPAASASASTGGGRYGNEGGGTDDEYGTRTPAPSAASGEASDDPGAEVYEVNIGDSDDGPYLTGKDGMALYVFGNDSANTSACSGGCAATWPPFTIDAGDELKAGAAVKGKLTTFARADGSMQVAYDRSPLYYYAADEAAGDTKGQGIGDVWFIAKP